MESVNILAAARDVPALRSGDAITRAYKSLIRSTMESKSDIRLPSLFIAKCDDIFVRPSLGQFTEAARLIVFRLSHQNNQNDAIFVCDANLTDVAGDFVSSCLPAEFFDYFFICFKHELWIRTRVEQAVRLDYR